jgi:hypothetical protein
MKEAVIAVVVFLAVLFGGVCHAGEAAPTPDSVPRMAIDDLKAQMGNPGVIILDVRATHDWDENDVMVKGAVREDPSKLESWINKYPSDKIIILYCN